MSARFSAFRARRSVQTWRLGAPAPPLLIEVNFFFGKKGLGGPRGFDELFYDAVMEWKASLQ